MVEGGAEKAWIFFRGFEIELYFRNTQKRTGREDFQALRERHIYVRYFEKPRIDNYLRITIGTREEMQTLFDFLKDYLTESSK